MLYYGKHTKKQLNDWCAARVEIEEDFCTDINVALAACKKLGVEFITIQQPDYKHNGQVHIRIAENWQCNAQTWEAVATEPAHALIKALYCWYQNHYTDV